MAIGDPYATVDDLKAYLDPDDWVGVTKYDALMGTILSAMSRKIDKECDRQFNAATTETAKLFRPEPGDYRLVSTDDFVLTDGFVLQTDPSGTGTFEVTWDAPFDYELLPLNGLVNDEPWPYEQIHATGGVWYPLIQFRHYGTVKVTAQWGWPQVPDAIHQATIILAAQYFKLKEAPFGITGFSGFNGTVGMKVKDINPLACELISDYEKNKILGGGM